MGIIFSPGKPESPGKKPKNKRKIWAPYGIQELETARVVTLDNQRITLYQILSKSQHKNQENDHRIDPIGELFL